MVFLDVKVQYGSTILK